MRKTKLRGRPPQLVVTRYHGLCPSVSPESRTPCHLMDNYDAHYKGHEGVYRNDRNWNSSLVAWATTPADHQRWRIKQYGN